MYDCSSRASLIVEYTIEEELELDIALLELDFASDELLVATEEEDFAELELDFTTDELLEATEEDESEEAEVELSHPIRKAIIRIDKMVLRKRFIIKKAPFFSLSTQNSRIIYYY